MLLVFEIISINTKFLIVQLWSWSAVKSFFPFFSFLKSFLWWRRFSDTWISKVPYAYITLKWICDGAVSKILEFWRYHIIQKWICDGAVSKILMFEGTLSSRKEFVKVQFVSEKFVKVPQNGTKFTLDKCLDKVSYK